MKRALPITLISLLLIAMFAVAWGRQRQGKETEIAGPSSAGATPGSSGIVVRPHRAEHDGTVPAGPSPQAVLWRG